MVEQHAPRAAVETTCGGVRFRRAARVIVLDAAGRLLLVRGHDADQPSRSWWFTVGGGIKCGETPRAAAARELREETGIAASPEQLEGPVATRCGIFRFFLETCSQHEEFFLLRVGCGVAVTQAGWTDQERDLLDELTWLTPQQLRAQPLEYFPRELPAIAEKLAAGWSGEVVVLGEQDDDADVA